MRVTIKEKDGSIYEFESSTIEDVYKKMKHYFKNISGSNKHTIVLIDNQDGEIVKTYTGTVYKNQTNDK